MPKHQEKYVFYENSVQSPEFHVEWFAKLYHGLRRRFPRSMREDFCGTFKLSCAWIELGPRNTGLALDLDPEPLAFGRARNLSKLSADQRKRLSVRRQDVLNPTRPLSDLIVACNFSFFVFQERKKLLRYFKAAHRSLTRDGALALEMAGGPGMIAKIKEQRAVKKNGKTWFTYVWDQKSFDPITHRSRYSIHFHVAPDRKVRKIRKIKDAFTYDWRLWTIPEVCDLLAEAGFKRSVVFWETSHRGRGTGEFLAAESGDNSFAWVAYVVGLK